MDGLRWSGVIKLWLSLSFSVDRLRLVKSKQAVDITAALGLLDMMTSQGQLKFKEVTIANVKEVYICF